MVSFVYAPRAAQNLNCFSTASPLTGESPSRLRLGVWGSRATLCKQGHPLLVSLTSCHLSLTSHNLFADSPVLFVRLSSVKLAAQMAEKVGQMVVILVVILVATPSAPPRTPPNQHPRRMTPHARSPEHNQAGLGGGHGLFRIWCHVQHRT